MTEPTRHAFQAEVAEVLKLVVTSLYSNKEVFLRELVSNAADALDKLRFQGLSHPELLTDGQALTIKITADPEAKTVTVADNGIGMTETELSENLGTIARSGTREFAKIIEQARANAESAPHLIGQFGVGFYSAFLVADKVEVISRAAGQEQAYRWTSDGKQDYTIEPATRETQGTSVTLHLREDTAEFLEEFRIRSLIQRYSDYINYTIELAAHKKDKDLEYSAINKASALWQRSPKEVTDEQYNEFYKHLTHDWEPPRARRHFHVEGTQEFTGLLFLPNNPPFDLFDPSSKHGVRLHVRRVLVMEACEEVLPKWLRFIKGVVDSEDLPLNVSRETLQDSRIVKIIRKQVVNHSLTMLEELANDHADDYRPFWEAFGPVLKEGLHFDPEEKKRIAQLLRFATSHSEESTSLKDYVSRMKEGQSDIYYAVGPTRKLLSASPQLESLRQKGFEVLYLTDPVDPFAISNLDDFDGKKLVDVMSADFKLPGDEPTAASEEDAKASEPLFKKVQEVLGNRVSEVRASRRLADSPACLVVPSGGLPPFLERMLKARQMDVPEVKRVLEINPEHALVAQLRKLHIVDPQSPKLVDWIELLFDQALLAEGSPVDDPARFARRLTQLMSEAAGAALS
jgi:molecular chaperone HtpG